MSPFFHQLPPFALALLLAPFSAHALTLPIDVTSTVEIEAINGFTGDIGLPIGDVPNVDVPSEVTLNESPSIQSLVVTELAGAVNVSTNASSELLYAITLGVTSTFSLWYEGTLSPKAGSSFATGISDPLPIAPTQPFQFTWSAQGMAEGNLTQGTVANASMTGAAAAFVAGTNQVEVPLGVDLYNDAAPDILTLTIDEVAVDSVFLNGVSLGGFSLDKNGNFVYDDSTFDEAGFNSSLELGNPVITLGTGTLVLSGSINPDIEPVTLTGDFETSVVPVPAAAWLLGPALLGLAGMGRRRRQAGTALSA